MLKKEPLSPEVRIKRRNRRLVVYGGLLGLFIGLYKWQPWEFDLVQRLPADPGPRVDPDAAKLFSPGTKILLVTAHPDDSEFYIGGTLKKLSRTAEIHQIICTDGDKGYYPFEDYEANRRVRRAEALEAARAWNGKTLRFLARPDGRLRADDGLVSAIQTEIERLRPDYVLAFDGVYPPRMSHQDHRRAGDATVLAAQRAKVPWILKFSTGAPNFFVDITDQWDDKRAYLAIHKSQFFGERLDRVANMVAHSAEVDGERSGVTLAEGFRCLRGDR